MSRVETELRDGARFAFGRNWARFLSTLDEERIREAETSLKAMLETDSLAGLRFLDVGSGSGLFSLAARRLGAAVVSFDYDPQSVACAEGLKARFFPGDARWRIESGSALDAEYLRSLGTFDVVYSWGVLHHTGDLARAMENAALPVAPGGRLFIALYNDQGRASRLWRSVKKLYCSSSGGKAAVCAVFVPYFFLHALASSLLSRRDAGADYKKQRGMSITHDWFDWLGGYPFEVAKPGEVFDFYRRRGFRLVRMTTIVGSGNNEFVFRRDAAQGR
jgi:2-polyprenyl-6-hydroxyphenyl methylase/3-demethylubiquinone-9 3-methyltransferase